MEETFSSCGQTFDRNYTALYRALASTCATDRAQGPQGDVSGGPAWETVLHYDFQVRSQATKLINEEDMDIAIRRRQQAVLVVRLQFRAKPPERSGIGGRRGGHLVEEEESREEAGSNEIQRNEEETPVNPVPELEQEEPRRSDPLPIRFGAQTQSIFRQSILQP